MTVKNEALLPIFAEAKALPAPHAGRLTARRSPDELEIAVQRHHAADRQRHHHRLERIHEMGAVPVPQRRAIQRPDTVVREDLPIPWEEARFVRPPGLRRERGAQELRDIADALAGTARAASRTSDGAAPAAHRGLPRGARASSCPRRRKGRRPPPRWRRGHGGRGPIAPRRPSDQTVGGRGSPASHPSRRLTSPALRLRSGPFPMARSSIRRATSHDRATADSGTSTVWPKSGRCGRVRLHDPRARTSSTL